MSKIEFQKRALPTNEKELGEYVAGLQRDAEGVLQEQADKIERMAAELKTANENVERVKKLEAMAKEQDEQLRVLHEGDRKQGSGNIERALRSLPVVHHVEKDEDYKGRVKQPLFNLLALSRAELRTYLDGEAYEWAMRFRKLNNMVVSADNIMRMATAGSPQRAAEYERRGGFKGLPMWSAFEETMKAGARALDIATAGGASEWVPTLYSSDKFDDVRDKLQVASQFRFLPMPQSPWTLPVGLGGMTAYVIPEAQADAVGSNTQITVSDPASSNATLTAKKMATLSWFSREIQQDSIVAILPAYDDEIAFAQAYGIENAVLNGQATATIDTGDDPATTNVRDHFDGIRRAAVLVGGAVDLSAGLTAEKLAAMIQVQGKYADPAFSRFITGYTGLAKALILKDGNGNLVYLTRERAGDAATLFTGAVGLLMGYPLVVSGAHPQNLNNSGIIDGVTTTKTSMLLCNVQPWIGGNRQGLETETDRSERFSYDQIGVRSIQRVAFKSLMTPSASKPFVVAGVGL